MINESYEESSENSVFNWSKVKIMINFMIYLYNWRDCIHCQNKCLGTQIWCLGLGRCDILQSTSLKYHDLKYKYIFRK